MSSGPREKVSVIVWYNMLRLLVGNDIFIYDILFFYWTVMEREIYVFGKPVDYLSLDEVIG